MVSDQNHLPNRSPPLTAPAQLGVMEHSLNIALFHLPSGYSLLSAHSHALICSCVSTKEDKQCHGTWFNTWFEFGIIQETFGLISPSPILPFTSPLSMCSPCSATQAWCAFHTFVTSSSGVSGVMIVNMIYGPCCWLGGKSGHSTGQDALHFTLAMPSQVLRTQCCLYSYSSSLEKHPHTPQRGIEE